METTCPSCLTPTKWAGHNRLLSMERRAQLNKQYPGRKWAVSEDGTCDKCYRLKNNLAPRNKAVHKKFTDAQVREASASLAAYMEDRRRRDVDPEGNSKLDARFEHDWPYIKAEQRSKQQERRREQNRINKQKQRERNETSGISKSPETGRVQMPTLRDDENARASTQEEPGDGRKQVTGSARKHHRALRTI